MKWLDVFLKAVDPSENKPSENEPCPRVDNSTIGQLWYLASPYTADTREQTESRVQLIEQFVKVLWQDSGIYPFSPVLYTHPFADEKTREDWYDADLIMLRRADLLLVCELEGIESSIGCKIEIAFAKGAGIPIQYISEDRIRSVIAAGTSRDLIGNIYNRALSEKKR